MDMYIALKAFVRTVEKGTITDAARALSISQPAVSKHLQNLERHLNTRLLERSSRKVRVTTQGMHLYESSRHSLTSIDAALEGLRLSAGDVQGVLRVHAPSSIGFHEWHDLLMAFQQEHAGIEVELVLDDRQVNLIHENYDIAVSYGKISSQEIIVRHVGWVRCVLVTTPEFLSSVGNIETPEKLASLNVISSSEIITHRNALKLYDRRGQPIEIRVHSGLKTNNSQVLINTISAGRAVGAVPLNLVSRELSSGSMIQVLPDYSIKSAEIFLTYPSTKFMRPIVRAFSDFLVPRLKSIEGVTSGPD